MAGRPVRTAQHHHAVFYSKRSDGIPVITRLRLPTLVRGDDEADHRGRPDSGKHVSQEAFVARYVNKRHILSGWQRGPGVTQIDSQPAAPFSLPTVRLHTGEGANQGAFAGIDVPGGGYD